ncbi:MAG: WXG100 family type VII secretion target [Lachnospiraceae bacterium]|nr:WXG100 family type VII secretion target [Lachnospiraceae bacterium]
MARGKIIVDTAKLDTIAKRVKSLADNYKTEYTKLYSHVSEMQSSWAGADNQAYTAQINGFKDDFQKMENIMRDYAGFLTKTAQKYRATQSDIKAKAKQLAKDA